MIRIVAPDPVPVSELATFVNDCWRHAYADILPADFLAGMTTYARVAILERALDAGSRVLVARDDDAPAGAARAGTELSGTGMAGMALYGPSYLDGWEEAGLLGALYVRPDLIGTGLGHRLLTSAETGLAAMGYTTYVLDVFSANLGAIDFYASHGYERAGGQTFDVVRGRVYPLDIMTKAGSAS